MELQSTTTIVREQFNKLMRSSFETSSCKMGYVDITNRHADLMDSKPEIWMFVKCDSEGNPLDEKEWKQFEGEMDDLKIILDKHRDAVDKRWFQGFKLHPATYKYKFPTIRDSNELIFIYWEYHDTGWELSKGINTIEDLVKFKLTLTDRKSKEVYGSI